jgi:uncharacterized protein YjiS (DUF1127 family)
MQSTAMRKSIQAQPAPGAALRDAAARAWRGAGDALRAIRIRTAAMVERSRQRHALSRLDDHVLKDIGLTREQAGHETDKWIWQT